MLGKDLPKERERERERGVLRGWGEGIDWIIPINKLQGQILTTAGIELSGTTVCSLLKGGESRQHIPPFHHSSIDGRKTMVGRMLYKERLSSKS